MGLLQKIQSQHKPPQNKAKGLIVQAEKYTHTNPSNQIKNLTKKLSQKNSLFIDESYVFFHDFSEAKSFSFSGILQLKQKNFEIIYTYNIKDANLFNSSADFWKGTLAKKNSWNSFQDEALSPFYQFFKDELNNRLEVHFKEFLIANTSYIFFFGIDKDTTKKPDFIKISQRVKDFIHIIDSYKVFFDIQINDKETLKEYTDKGLSSYTHAYSMKLYNKILNKNTIISLFGLTKIKASIVYFLENFLPKPSFIQYKKDIFSIVLFSNTNMDKNLFFELLKKYLSDYLHYSTIENFEIQSFECFQNAKEVEDFLPI